MDAARVPWIITTNGPATAITIKNSDTKSDRPRIDDNEKSQITQTPTKQGRAHPKGTAIAAMAKTNRVESSANTPFSVLNMKVSMNET